MIFENQDKKQMLSEVEKHQISEKAKYQVLKDKLKQDYPDAKIVPLNFCTKEQVLGFIYTYDDPSYFKFIDMSKLENSSKEELIYSFSNILTDKFSASEIYSAGIKAIEEREQAELNNLTIHLSNKSEFTKARIQETIKFLKVMRSRGITVQVKILSDYERMDASSKVPYYFDKKEIKELLHLERKLNSFDMQGLLFCDRAPYVNGNEDWTLNQVINANNKLDSYVDQIKRLKLTPFEAMITIHKIASNYVYQEANGISAEHSSTLVGVLNGDKIICQGYASLVKAIVDRLNMPGLNAEIAGLQCKNSYGSSYFHANNIIHIQDETYNINGTYIEDACWDCRKDENSPRRGLVHCLYPVQDIDKISKYEEIKPVEMTKSVTLYYDEEGGMHYNVEYKDLSHLKSKPISYQKYKQGFTNVLEKQGRDDIQDRVNEEMQITEKRVKARFKNPENDFAHQNEQGIYRE